MPEKQGSSSSLSAFFESGDSLFGLDGQRAAGIGAERGMRQLHARPRIDLRQRGLERIALVARDRER